MKTHEDKQVINGTYGEIWVDDIYLASLTKFNAVVNMTYGEVQRPRDLWDGYKLIKLDGAGEIVVQKVSSLGFRLMHQKLDEGKTPVAKIVGKLADPDAIGAERIAIENVVFEKLTLMDFEHAKISEESISFKFRHYQLYDMIEE